MKEKADYSFEINFKSETYTADVWHYTQLTIKERLDHHIAENTYLVYLTGHKPFEIFIGEDLEWHTQSTFVVEDEIVQIIGLHIHNKTM